MKNLILFLFFCINSFVFAQNLKLSTFPKDKVMVISHRGDWREAPENSIWSVKKAIEKGANMVEIDLALTKDSVLVLMHDKTIDRTTTGRGKIEDYTYKDLEKFNLKDGLGSPTKMKIPKLEEVLELTKGKIFVNLDKGFEYVKLSYPLVKKLGLLEEILFKGEVSFGQFLDQCNSMKEHIHFMPVIRLDKENGENRMDDYKKNYKVYGYEFVLGESENVKVDFDEILKNNQRVWVNSLWSSLSAGHYDDLALENPNIYDWYLRKKINAIQTDRIYELIKFLKSKNKYVSNDKLISMRLHNLKH